LQSSNIFKAGYTNISHSAKYPGTGYNTHNTEVNIRETEYGTKDRRAVNILAAGYRIKHCRAVNMLAAGRTTDITQQKPSSQQCILNNSTTVNILAVGYTVLEKCHKSHSSKYLEANILHIA
jgi:hypothetical protein